MTEVLDYVREDEEYHNVTELLLEKSKNGTGIFLLDLYIESFNGRITTFVEEHLKERAKYLNLSERITNPAADASKYR